MLITEGSTKFLGSFSWYTTYLGIVSADSALAPTAFSFSAFFLLAEIKLNL